MDEKKKDKLSVDFREIARVLLSKKTLFLKVWVITFILSCVWILPQPRYYVAEVSVSPESGAPSGGGGGLASLASSFGVNVGSNTADAIYPQLYPDLFGSTNFLVGLFDVKVKTLEGDIETDYYTYMDKHQKQNFLLWPFVKAKNWVTSLIAKPDSIIAGQDGKRFNPFILSRHTTAIMEKVKTNISCTYSRTTDVVTITVQDQDPLVCALLADSVKKHLQVFITDYRTKKSRNDYEHYKLLAAEAKDAYDQARQAYASFADSHQDVYLQSVKTKIDNLEYEMQQKYSIYSSMSSNMETANQKVQENTPAFTTLTNATVPIKPAGPKRMIFVAAMLFLATFGTICKLFKKELIEWF